MNDEKEIKKLLFELHGDMRALSQSHEDFKSQALAMIIELNSEKSKAHGEIFKRIDSLESHNDKQEGVHKATSAISAGVGIAGGGVFGVILDHILTRLWKR